MSEAWLPVVGYKDVYEVSDMGRVRRVAGGKGARAGRILSERRDRKGYIRVALHNGHRLDRAVHRLVATAFIGPPPSATHEVNHRDGVKHNNHVSNLEWATPCENMQHAVDTGLFVAPRGEEQGRSKLTEEQVAEIRALTWKVPKIDVAAMYGVSDTLIALIQEGRAWKHSMTGPPPPRPPRTHCAKGHPLDEENTYVDPSSGRRRCRTCTRLSQRKTDAFTSGEIATVLARRIA